MAGAAALVFTGVAVVRWARAAANGPATRSSAANDSRTTARRQIA